MNLHSAILATFPGAILIEFSGTVASTWTAAIVVFLIGVLAAKNKFTQASGLDKVVVLGNLFFALPLAVFSAEHFAAAQGISTMVPSWMPWHLFWAYFVGFALISAALSIALRIQVAWSGTLLGIMFVLFVAMMDIPGVVADSHNRISWTLALRELAFAGGAWALAGSQQAEDGRPASDKFVILNGRFLSLLDFGKSLARLARFMIAIPVIFYGVENFLHPVNVPGVPLEKLMPVWIPGRLLIGYLTAVVLVICGVSMLRAKKTRMAATYLGTWIVLLVLLVYLPILIASMLNPSTDVKVEGINYFFDTMLFAGTILALASATPRTD